jgi:hypothetical protein
VLETLTPSALCPDCGASLDSGTERCPACEAESLAPVTALPECNDTANGASSGTLGLVVRGVGALVYFGLCILMLYCSIPFFEDGDWWFGAMAVGLAVVAVVGIKQSLFPKEWTPE